MRTVKADIDVGVYRFNVYETRSTSMRARSGVLSAVKSGMAFRLLPVSRRLKSWRPRVWSDLFSLRSWHGKGIAGGVCRFSLFFVCVSYSSLVFQQVFLA